MPPVDRNNPVRGKGSQSKYSLMEFMREFPDDAACLDWLWHERHAPDGHTTFCPKCDRSRRFHKVADRPAWDCDSCGYHLHPLAGTIFHKSSTSLHLWFYAMFLISQTRCGISAKQLERELGVTYKTAWRMFNLIRNQLMDESDGEPLSGDVEVDETYVGGKPRAYESRTSHRARVGRTWRKETVLGLVERGGRVKVVHLPDRGGVGIKATIHEHVLPESMIFTDEWPVYQGIGKGYIGHRRIQHRAKVYVDGDNHTQTVEGFFGLTKNGIRGVYHAVSAKWLQGYLNEYAWRYNRRFDREPMFTQLLLRAAH
ncbi:IS1595 family transposase [soil metagenome]